MRTLLIVNGVALTFETQDGIRIALGIAAGTISRRDLIGWLTLHTAR